MPKERVGAAVVVWRRGADGPEFLLLHRTGADESGPWCWTFPSGGCDDGESLEDCARRELEEETGFDLPLTRLDVPSGHPVFLAEADAAELDLDALDDEHDRYMWAPEEGACAMLLPTRVADSLRVAARLISHP